MGRGKVLFMKIFEIEKMVFSPSIHLSHFAYHTYLLLRDIDTPDWKILNSFSVSVITLDHEPIFIIVILSSLLCQSLLMGWWNVQPEHHCCDLIFIGYKSADFNGAMQFIPTKVMILTHRIPQSLVLRNNVNVNIH